MIYNGIPTRLVPSLDGSLFRFHDDSFEPLPFTAETLLSSSFKLPGDSTVVGSKDLRTVGISPSCGKVSQYTKSSILNSDSNSMINLADHHMMSYETFVIVRHITYVTRKAARAVNNTIYTKRMCW